ncbi:putative DNA-binding protein [Clostridium sp. SYSU_GA19001]|uniref:putative DNA-binding protein n=1 Tax=Clostridium caldaquaticum TaxID=2940653 RepID=UPI0020774665|nr:putative DNA-binding protein [Clostridium caldaquaticum]MCM8710599.1 putative DNA-binding protein [Clostridium caldaquaticum]
MEERIEISILLDFYGELLTQKQKDIMTMYYNEDLSLGEIAELNNTSRQAIHDIIKRCNKLLLEYEQKLELMNKYNKFNLVKTSILNKCKLIRDKIDDLVLLNYIDEIEKDINENI